jgi:hypothetical protein
MHTMRYTEAMRNGVYGLRLPPEERRRYERAARAEGLTLAAWLRRAARREAERSALSDEAGRLTRVKRGLASLGTLSAAEARSLRRGVRRSREAWSRDRR